MLLVAEENPVHTTVVAELDPIDVVGDEAGAEALGLGAKLVHHLRPHDPLRVAGVVLDVGRVLQLAAPLEALEDKGLEVGSRGVERGRIAGRPAADDDHVLDSVLLAHICRQKSNTLLCIVALGSSYFARLGGRRHLLQMPAPLDRQPFLFPVGYPFAQLEEGDDSGRDR